MTDQRLRDAERAWLNDPDAADAYDVEHKRAGLPDLSPPRRQAVKPIPRLLRAYLIRRVKESTERGDLLGSATWAEAEDAVRLMLSNPEILEMVYGPDEAANLLSLVMGIRMVKMRADAERWRRARDTLNFAREHATVNASLLDHIVGTRSGRMTGFSSLGAELMPRPEEIE